MAGALDRARVYPAGMAMSVDERDRRFRHLRQAGLSRPATEAILEELADLHKRLDELEARQTSG